MIGTSVAERLVETYGIVKGFDVLEHAHPRCFEVGERLMLRPLVLEGSAKNRTEVEQRIPGPLVNPLKAFLKGLPPDQPIWPGNWVTRWSRARI